MSEYSIQRYGYVTRIPVSPYFYPIADPWNSISGHRGAKENTL
jgi:hypothetical protein